MTLAMPVQYPSPSELELLAMIRSIHLERRTGLVELATEGSEKQLYFVTGELYLLASTPLARKIAKLLRLQVWGDQGSHHTLARLYARIAERFSSWHTRSFSFNEGRRAPAQELVGPLPTARILMAAATKEQALEHLRRRLVANGVRIVATEPAIRPAAVATAPDETALLSAIDEPISLEELLAAFDDGEEAVFGSIARLWAVGWIREATETPAAAGAGEPDASLGAVDSGRDTEPASVGAAEVDEIWSRHFGLAGDPFSLTPDPAFLFISEGHGEALAGLKLGLLERRGLLAMTGEVGTGKTTLLYTLLSSLDPEIEAAYIYNTTLSCEEILQNALLDFGVSYSGSSRLDLLEALNDFLTRLAANDRTAALVIDEAQNLSDETFEQLRLLLNFETFDRKLLQIVLVGQPELARKLEAPELRQIADRIAVRCHLDPLSKNEAGDYVLHRLKAAGASSEVFSRQARRLVVRKARGIPRRINVLCHNAMLFAYAAGERKVGRAFVREALRDRRASILETMRGRHGMIKVSNQPESRGFFARVTDAVKRSKGAWLGILGLAAAAWLVATLAEHPAESRATDSGRAPILDPAGALDPVDREVVPQPAGRRTGSSGGSAAIGRPESRGAEPTGARSAEILPNPWIGTTTANLRLRSAPGLQHPVLVVLPAGSQVSVLGTESDWLRVNAPELDRSGWVKSSFVVAAKGRRTTEQDGMDSSP